MDAFAPEPVVTSALRAFPAAAKPQAELAFTTLSPFVDGASRQGVERYVVEGQEIALPRRLHFTGLGRGKVERLSLAPACLASRSTDGRLRQAAVRSLFAADEAWAGPYVLSLLGEYVIEIVEDIGAALPLLNRAVYADLVRRNPVALRTIRARATSYWNVYYRTEYLVKRHYPALRILDELESWAG